jgi:hypothetical protein
MTRKVWKLSDTVAAAFFGIWLFSLFFRSFFGGLDIIVFIVAGLWALSIWARVKGGECNPPVLTEENEKALTELDEKRREMALDPAYRSFAGNVWNNHDE